MKMILAIIDDQYSDLTSKALVKSKFRVTRLASTGGFLRGGATTLMIGVEEEHLQTALGIIREKIPITDVSGKINGTIYVLNVKDYRRV